MRKPQTPAQLANLIPWQPGQSGNPSGKPKHCKETLGEDFYRVLGDAVAKHGEELMATLAREHPTFFADLIVKMASNADGAGKPNRALTFQAGSVSATYSWLEELGGSGEERAPQILVQE